MDSARADRLADDQERRLRQAENDRLKNRTAALMVAKMGYVWNGRYWKTPPHRMSPEAAERCQPRFTQYPENMSNAGFGQRPAAPARSYIGLNAPNDPEPPTWNEPCRWPPGSFKDEPSR